MSFKKTVTKNIIAMLLILTLTISGITFLPATVSAAGWLDYAGQSITLGNSVNGSIKTGDYCGPTELYAGYKTYWHIYKFSMPQDGLLNMYIESASPSYLNYSYDYGRDGFAIFPVSNPDDILWRSRSTENKIVKNFSSSRAMYYGTTEISLNQGEYYFAIRQYKTNDIPYYLTLSYKEPIINVTSISLKPAKMSILVGNQQTINATVLPVNSTDQTIIWESADPSVATVDNGTVTAVSSGTTSITATSADGEISDTCVVTVTCNHIYRTSVIQADTKNDGSIGKKCTICGNEIINPIYAVKNVNLSTTTYTYNGKIRKPVVTISDSMGNTLKYGRDYTISYSGNNKNVGKYSIAVVFTGNYKGSVQKTFTITPKPANISKIKLVKKGLTVIWKKQENQISGYEISYSMKSSFPKKSTYTIMAGKNKSSKTISNLKKGKLYYVKIRTYKNIKINGKYTKLYSNWSKVQSAMIKNF